MKKLFVFTIITFIFSSCEKTKTAKDLYKETLYMPQTDDDAIETLRIITLGEDSLGIEAMTNTINGDNPKEILKKYAYPNFKIVKETSDGRFGIKRNPNVSLYFVKFEPHNAMPMDTFVIGVQATQCCGYKIINFSKPVNR